MSSLSQFHIENDLHLPKITLLRWLKERMSAPKSKTKWQKQRELLSRRSRYFTAAEVKLLLKLASAPYVGRKGVDPLVVKRLKKAINLQRNTIVQRVIHLLSNV